MITFVTTKIAIGDADDARAATAQDFEASLNVAVDLDIEDPPSDDSSRLHIRRHKIGLVDGRGNDPLTMAAALLLLHSLVNNGKKVLVHCHAGQSRSVMVVAMYCDLTGISPIDDSLKKILKLRKVDNYRQDLYTTANEALSIAKQIIVIPAYGKEQ